MMRSWDAIQCQGVIPKFSKHHTKLEQTPSIAAMTDAVTLFVGTYTRVEGHVPEGRGKGIYAFSLNPATGELASLGEAQAAGINPSFITGTKTALYAANECNEPSASGDGSETGFVRSFAIGEGGKLTETSRQESKGTYPCHVALNGAKDFLTATNYGGGNVALYPVNADGSLGALADSHFFPGSSGVVPDRQEAAHVHSSIWVDDALLAADLGNDTVPQFRLDRNAKKLVPNSVAAVTVRAPGSGPRHFAVHPSRKFVYVLGELGNSIGVHGFDESTGALAAKATQEIGTLPEDFTAWSLVADIHVSTDGKFVYASNRGHDTIAIFRITNEETGELELIERVPTRGKTPRNFLVFRDLVLVANQDSHSIQVFRVDAATGKWTFTGHEVEVASPSSLFIPPQ